MKRALIYSFVGTIILGGAFAYLLRFRQQVLSPAELASRNPGQPAWTDQRDCARVQGILDEARDEKPLANAEPLSADETAVYRAVLSRWIKDFSETVYVSNQTFPLGAYHSEKCECFEGVDDASLSTATRSYKDLTRDVLPAKNVRLVDPERHTKVVRYNDPDRGMRRGKSIDRAVNDAYATGLFSMSGIAFDKEHRRAVVSFSFVCGSLCGQGATLMLKKVKDEWKVADPNCAGWIS